MEIWNSSMLPACMLRGEWKGTVICAKEMVKVDFIEVIMNEVVSPQYLEVSRDWTLGGIYLQSGLRNMGRGFLQKWSMLLECQCLRGFWTMSLITCLDFWPSLSFPFPHHFSICFAQLLSNSSGKIPAVNADWITPLRPLQVFSFGLTGWGWDTMR